jgi:hypothetical protein
MTIKLSYEQTRAVLKYLRTKIDRRTEKESELIEVEGEYRTAKEWAELSKLKYGNRGIDTNLIYKRRQLGKTGYDLIRPIDEDTQKGKAYSQYNKALHKLRNG